MDLKEKRLSNEARARITGIPPPRAAPTAPSRPRPVNSTGINQCSHPYSENQNSATTGVPVPNANTAATPLGLSDLLLVSTANPISTPKGEKTQDAAFLAHDTIEVAPGISAPRGNNITQMPSPSRNSRNSSLLQRTPTLKHTRTSQHNPTTRHNPASHRCSNTQPTPNSARNPRVVCGNLKGASCSKEENASREKASFGKRDITKRTRLNPQQSKKRFLDNVIGWFYWTSLRLRYSRVGNWVALEVADTVIWWSKIGEKKSSAVARPVFKVGQTIESTITWLLHTIMPVVNGMCLLLIVALDSMLGIVYRLVALFPWRPAMVFGTIILASRIPIALWCFAPTWQSFLSFFAYGTWVLWISNRYVWEPEAWHVCLGMPRSWRIPEFWWSPLFWNLVAIIIIVWAEIVGLTEPFLLSVQERHHHFVPPR